MKKILDTPPTGEEYSNFEHENPIFGPKRGKIS